MMAGDSQRFCLKWNDFRNSVTSVFEDLRQDGELVDITLCCEGKKVKAHRMMLSACSPYFRDLLKENPCQHPVFFLKDTTFSDLQAVVEFVYSGEVNVTQGQLSSFLKTAEMLQLRGLTGDDDKDSGPAPPSPRSQPRPAPPAAAPRPFPRPVPAAPLPVSRPPPPPVRRPLVPAVPPPPPPPANSVAVPSRTAAPPAESPPVSPATKRRRVHSGSGSGSNDGLETASASPAATPPSGSDTAPPPPLPPPAPPVQTPTTDPAGSGFGHGGPVKVEKVDIDIADDEDDMAALGQVVDYEGSYDSNQSLGAIPVADASQVSGMLAAAAAGPSADGGAGSSGSVSCKRQWLTRGGFQCSQCGRRYRHPTGLLNHMELHRGQTRCLYCDRVYATKNSLKSHMENVHLRDGKLPREEHNSGVRVGSWRSQEPDKGGRGGALSDGEQSGEEPTGSVERASAGPDNC